MLRLGFFKLSHLQVNFKWLSISFFILIFIAKIFQNCGKRKLIQLSQFSVLRGGDGRCFLAAMPWINYNDKSHAFAILKAFWSLSAHPTRSVSSYFSGKESTMIPLSLFVPPPRTWPLQERLNFFHLWYFEWCKTQNDGWIVRWKRTEVWMKESATKIHDVLILDSTCVSKVVSDAHVFYPLGFLVFILLLTLYSFLVQKQK